MLFQRTWFISQHSIWLLTVVCNCSSTGSDTFCPPYALHDMGALNTYVGKHSYKINSPQTNKKNWNCLWQLKSSIEHYGILRLNKIKMTHIQHCKAKCLQKYNMPFSSVHITTLVRISKINGHSTISAIILL